MIVAVKEHRSRRFVGSSHAMRGFGDMAYARVMRAPVMLIAMAGGLAWADAPKPQPSAADQNKYRELLGKGRELEAKQKLTEAIATFQQALAVIPDDATVLAEIGWTAYQAHDLKQAEAMTRRSLANEGAPSLRGATLYNLGKIQEALSNKIGAIASYGESLRVRPNGIVRAALAKLDATAAAAFDPFKPAALAGPFASIDAFCKATKRPNEDGNLEDCSCGDVDPKAPKPTLAAPFDEAKLFLDACSAPHTENARMQYDLGIRVGKSWFVAKYGELRVNRHCELDLKDDAVAVTDGVLQLKATETGSCIGGDIGSDWTTEWRVIVGLGASGIPAAPPPIVVKRHTVDQTDMFGPAAKKRVSADIALEVSVSKDRTLEIKGRTTGLDSSESSNVLGKHRLVFP